jgi:hypothetical protein
MKLMGSKARKLITLTAQVQCEEQGEDRNGLTKVNHPKPREA